MRKGAFCESDRVKLTTVIRVDWWNSLVIFTVPGDDLEIDGTIFGIGGSSFPAVFVVASGFVILSDRFALTLS